MPLRLKLIVAFLLLSVVPLSAVTLVSYRSSVRALEAAAQREAADTAAHVGRRMQMITADVGRRVDRAFVESEAPQDPNAPPQDRVHPDSGTVRARIASLLGDVAALVDRVEFEPNPPVPPTSSSEDPARPDAPPPPGRRAGLPPHPGASRPPQPPIPPIVLDVPQIIEEAHKTGRIPGVGAEIAARLREKLEKNRPALEEFSSLSESVATEAAARAADAERTQTAVDGHRVDVTVRRDGQVMGKAHATLNMERTLRTVLMLARRDQGEIPFAIDPGGKLYTPDPREEPALRALSVDAQRSPGAGTRRSGDWIVVSKQDAGGIVFGIARPIGESLREIRRASVSNLMLGLGVVVLALIGIVPISGRMTQHLSTLTNGVRQIAGGDFHARVPVRSRDEFGALASAFNQMAADLERHQALVVEQERLRRELELSRLIQTEMLPHAPLTIAAAEIKGISIPAREVGGDFFNYFALPDGRLALLVGDVSGKGVSAALLMANVQATLRARLPLEQDLARLAAALDLELDRNTPPSVYVTLFIAILDADGRTLHYVNAGHNPQFVLRGAGGIEPMGSTGLPIALFAGHAYRESLVDLASGDLLFFYTDGLVETENEAEEMFGAERLQALLVTEQAAGIDRVLDSIETAVRGFRGAAEPFDDATMMAMKVRA